jgi:hypothetical protein
MAQSSEVIIILLDVRNVKKKKLTTAGNRSYANILSTVLFGSNEVNLSCSISRKVRHVHVSSRSKHSQDTMEKGICEMKEYFVMRYFTK